MQQQAQATRTQVDELNARRSVLEQQREELMDQRRELVIQRQQMNGERGRGHDVRIAAMDDRAAQIEVDMAHIDQVLASMAGGGRLVFAEGQPGRSGADLRFREGVGAGITSMLALWALWLGARRFIWKRRPNVIDQTTHMQQLQNSMDVIALEVERISEGQRFVAKVLNERLLAGAELPVGAKERK